ncbi:hypothetical protein 16Q_159c [Pseudomonas phage 16Q]|nr:hypothetical protein 16Q_159c [Pseudomonas phage 16Q]
MGLTLFYVLCYYIHISMSYHFKLSLKGKALRYCTVQGHVRQIDCINSASCTINLVNSRNIGKRKPALGGLFFRSGFKLL